MKIPALKPTMRTVTLLAVVAGMLFCAGIFTYVVCSRHLRTASLDLENKQKQVLDSKEIAEGLASIQTRYLETREQIGFLETSVSTHAYVPTLLKQLEALGTEMNLKVISVRPIKAPPAAPPPIKRSSEEPGSGSESGKASNVPDGQATEQPKPYEELRIDIELEGTYWHAHNFMYRLTTFPKIIAVNEVHMSPAGAVAGLNAPKLLVKLSVTAFIFNEDEGGQMDKQQNAALGRTQGGGVRSAEYSESRTPHSSFLIPHSADRRLGNDG